MSRAQGSRITGPAMERGPDGKMHVFDCGVFSVGGDGKCDERECSGWRQDYGLE